MLTNPVLIGVIVMIILCLVRFNILLSIMIASIVAGLIAGMPLFGELGVLPIFVDGMSGNLETALSYILLGTLAFAVGQTGLATILSLKLQKVFGKSSFILLISLTIISCFSQNLIPIHIAFIPILIPALIPIMNKMKVDRRAAATTLTFGLVAPYILLPFGFGYIYHGIIVKSMKDNGLEFFIGDVWKVMLLPALGMILGLLVSILISYRKPREYKEVHIENDKTVDTKFTKAHWGALLGALTAFTVQLAVVKFNPQDTAGALPLGALCGIIIMIAFGSIPFSKTDDAVIGGIKLMGFIAFVMLVASGFGAVLRATGGVEDLVSGTTTLFGNSKLLASIVMLTIGLIITMGIGTSFGTIPILATIYVPLGVTLGFSPQAIALLIGVAGALGDAGSPASDSTMGPTSGLNVDGQHDHISDTCIPTFLHYNIPLLIFGVIGSLVL